MKFEEIVHILSHLQESQQNKKSCFKTEIALHIPKNTAD